MSLIGRRMHRDPMCSRVEADARGRTGLESQRPRIPQRGDLLTLTLSLVIELRGEMERSDES